MSHFPFLVETLDTTPPFGLPLRQPQKRGTEPEKKGQTKTYRTVVYSSITIQKEILIGMPPKWSREPITKSCPTPNPCQANPWKRVLRGGHKMSIIASSSSSALGRGSVTSSGFAACCTLWGCPCWCGLFQIDASSSGT